MTSLRLKPECRRVFWAPCDSHGIQSLIKHINELEWFRTVFKDTSTVVTFSIQQISSWLSFASI